MVGSDTWDLQRYRLYISQTTCISIKVSTSLADYLQGAQSEVIKAVTADANSYTLRHRESC